MTKVNEATALEIVRQIKAKIPAKVVALNLNLKLRQVYYHLEKAEISPKKHFVRNKRLQPADRPTISLAVTTYKRLKEIQSLYGLTSMNKTVIALLNMTQVETSIERRRAEVDRQIRKKSRHAEMYQQGTPSGRFTSSGVRPQTMKREDS